MTWLVVLVGVMAIAACGGSGGGASQAAKDAAEASGTSFGTLMNSAGLQPCLDTPPQQCDCPGGGTVATTVGAGGAMTATFTGCKSADVKTFTGTLSGSEGSSTVTANMSVFGECTNVTGSAGAPGSTQCSGSLGGTCAGESLTCGFTETQQGDCDLSC